MSDPVTASTAYSNSIKFYEQMSHLQEELKTYESQHFNLEEEFQRLWTQRTSVPFSNGVQPKNTTSLAHLSEKSQLLANPTNTNLRNYGDQDSRRARNTAILDKLQELETNASIFAARSERLRMMRDEYETLVRKYSTNRNRKQTDARNLGNGDQQKNDHPINMISTSVNTDISGPVIAVTPPKLLTHLEKSGSLNIDIPSEETQITFPGVTSRHSQQPCPHPDGHGLIAISDPDTPTTNPNFSQSATLPQTNPPSLSIPPIRRKSTFFTDISSTTTTTATESVDWDSKLKEQRPHNYQMKSEQVGGNNYSDEDETTSFSGLPSKHQSSNNIQNISTDGSLSECTSTNARQRHVINKGVVPRGGDGGSDKGGPFLPSRSPVITNVGENKTRVTTNSMGKTFMISSAPVDERDSVRLKPTPEEKIVPEREDYDRDDSMASVGDSVMDSIYNKTPDSLPRDDSELLLITQGDEVSEAGGVGPNEVLEPRTASPLPNRNEEPQPLLEETHIQSSPQRHRPIYSPPNVVDVVTRDAPQNSVPTFFSDGEDKEIMSTGSFAGVYVTSEQDQDAEASREFEFNGSGRNKGVAINGDVLGGVGNEFGEKGPPPNFNGSGTRNKSEVNLDPVTQGSTAKLKMKNDKKGKPSARKKLKMDYGDSESEEGSEKAVLPSRHNPSLQTALKQDRVPTKEELDAEFEDFFN